MSRKLISLLLAVLPILLLASAVLAAPQVFTLTWWTVDDGGGASSSEDYALIGTIGQPDPSPLMSSGNFTIVGGFWGGGSLLAQSYQYLPIALK